MTATIGAPASAPAPGGEPATRGRGTTTTVVGQTPRVSLLPPEINERHKQKSVQRAMRLAVFGVLVLTLGGVGATFYLATMAALDMVAAQSRQQTLITEQAQYADTQNALNAVALGEAALAVGGSTEVDWQDYLNRVQAALPAGVVIDAFGVDASTVTEQYPQADAPLQGARVATLQFSAISPGIPEIPAWMDGLRTLPGFVDANPDSVTQREEGGYVATITMHIDSKVYTNRLVQEDEEAADSAAETDAEAQG